MAAANQAVTADTKSAPPTGTDISSAAAITTHAMKLANYAATGLRFTISSFLRTATREQWFGSSPLGSIPVLLQLIAAYALSDRHEWDRSGIASDSGIKFYNDDGSEVRDYHRYLNTVPEQSHSHSPPSKQTQPVVCVAPPVSDAIRKALGTAAAVSVSVSITTLGSGVIPPLSLPVQRVGFDGQTPPFHVWRRIRGLNRVSSETVTATNSSPSCTAPSTVSFALEIIKADHNTSVIIGVQKRPHPTASTASTTPYPPIIALHPAQLPASAHGLFFDRDWDQRPNVKAVQDGQILTMWLPPVLPVVGGGAAQALVEALNQPLLKPGVVVEVECDLITNELRFWWCGKPLRDVYYRLANPVAAAPPPAAAGGGAPPQPAPAPPPQQQPAVRHPTCEWWFDDLSAETSLLSPSVFIRCPPASPPHPAGSAIAKPYAMSVPNLHECCPFVAVFHGAIELKFVAPDSYFRVVPVINIGGSGGSGDDKL